MKSETVRGIETTLDRSRMGERGETSPSPPNFSLSLEPKPQTPHSHTKSLVSQSAQGEGEARATLMMDIFVRSFPNCGFAPVFGGFLSDSPYVVASVDEVW